MAHLPDLPRKPHPLSLNPIPPTTTQGTGLRPLAHPRPQQRPNQRDTQVIIQHPTPAPSTIAPSTPAPFSWFPPKDTTEKDTPEEHKPEEGTLGKDANVTLASAPSSSKGDAPSDGVSISHPTPAPWHWVRT
jgi:hypothetical protein